MVEALACDTSVIPLNQCSATEIIQILVTGFISNSVIHSLTGKTMDEAIQINDSWYVKADSTQADLQTRVLKNGDFFAIFDRLGDIQPIGIGEHGLFFEGMRYLSHLEMLVNQRRPMLLNSSVSHDNTLISIDLTTPDLYENGQLYMGKGKLHIFRSKLIWKEQYYEHFRFTNYDRNNLSFDVSFSIGSDYADIFEVRGMTRKERGVDQDIEIENGLITFGYIGLDEILYQTRVDFDPPPLINTGYETNHSLSIPAQESQDIYLRVSCCKPKRFRKKLTFAKAYENCRKQSIATRSEFVNLNSSSKQFNDWLGRSASDLRLLISDTEDGLYPYAGIPWFCTPFGRDGIITALQCLWIYPDLARGVLQYLAYNQATKFEPENDAEPGKIVHETRKGEMARLGEIPFSKYYGSVDSTPLFLILAGRYFERSADLKFIQELWPHLLAAVEWIDNFGDMDNDGFVEYERKSNRGILQQGWKNSNDSIFHHDGKSATGPVALCEVQAYVYEAKIQMSRLSHLLGNSEKSQKLESEAAALKSKFHKHFWLEDLQTYAIALDGEKRACKIRSSNAGHTLFSNIAQSDSARTLVQTLLSPKSFSDWGVRTIAAGEANYNPMSYHNGGVWPHDNSIIAMGLAQYGFKTEASSLLTGMFNTAIAVDLHRLPEFICGFHKRPGQGPTLNPVACSPQAWASGSVFMMMQAILGLSFSPEKPEITFKRPLLPDYLDSIHISNLKAGTGKIDLVIRRNGHEAGVHVIRKDGDVDMSVIM